MMMNQSCPLGLTAEDLDHMLGTATAKRKQFGIWMTGQTGAVCDGRQFNYDTRKYQATPCADNPHGLVVYRYCVERFLAGLPPLD